MPFIGLLAAVLGLWAWLWLTGTILVFDRSGTVARAEVVTWSKPRTMRRLPAGLWVALPTGDGAVRLVCRDGSRREYGYVTSATHLWLRIAEDGHCRRAELL